MRDSAHAGHPTGTGEAGISGADPSGAPRADSSGTHRARTSGTPRADVESTPGARDGAILLAGGRASRLDGGSKPGLVVDGRPLIDTVLAAVQAADPIVVVGPDTLARPGVVLAQEDPPFGGPAAGLVAGLAALAKAAPRATDTAATSTSATDTARMAGADPVPDPGARRARQPGPEWVWLLACDLPRASEVVALIAASVAAAPLGLAEDGVILVDTAERDQWLAGRYRRSSLERAGAAVSSQQNAPLRAIVGSLNLRRIMDESGVAVDLDTWDDVDRYRARPAHPHLEREGAADERREDTR